VGQACQWLREKERRGLLGSEGEREWCMVLTRLGPGRQTRPRLGQVACAGEGQEQARLGREKASRPK